MESAHPGLQLGRRYTLLERRAAGATATVWLASDDFLQRRVAVKILHPHLADDVDLAGRFAQEAHAAAMVSHPGLVAVYDTITGPPPAIVMEWVEGIDLRQRLDRGPLTATDVAAIGESLCDALCSLHAAGLVHRDIKPANVLLTADSRPKLADFGIATVHAGDRTATGIVLGTAKYLSPEQVRGDQIDHRTDIYALAAVLYEALAGNAPFVREGDLATALARLDSEPADLRAVSPAVPAVLAAAVMGGLTRDPAHRWPDAKAFAAALTAETVAPSTVALAPTPLLPPPRGSTPATKRRRWPPAVGFVLFVAVGWLGWQLISLGSSDGTGPSVPPAIEAVSAFDPEGTGAPGEHDDLSPLAHDGDLGTSWHTERYQQRDLGLKSGVGLVVELTQNTNIESISIDTGTTGWAVEIAVADRAGLTRSAYGPAVASARDVESSTEFSVEASGRFILVWFTDLGDGPTPLSLHVREITVR